MNMKQCLIAITMVLTLGLSTEATAQKHRHTPRTEQVDSTQNKKDAIEAFSDTTTVADSAGSQGYVTHRQVNMSDEDARGIVREVMGSLDDTAIFGMLTALGILFIIFVLFPIVIIVGIVWLINRNRRDKYKLAQMAVQNGQPIPEDLLKETTNPQISDEYQKGLRQMFTGIGLAIFLGIVAGKIGFGIGALVFFIGLGKWFIARNQQQADKNASMRDYTDNIDNHSNTQNNE